MIIQILRHTPIWVFGLFFLLLYLGYIQSKTRTVSRWRLLIVPLAMVGLSVYGVWSAFGANLIGLTSWGAAMVFVLLLSQITKRPRGVTLQSGTGLFTLPGSWLPLILMMIIFFTRYAVAVSLTINASLRSLAFFVVMVSSVYGLLSGLFAAPAVYVCRIERKGAGGYILINRR